MKILGKYIFVKIPIDCNKLADDFVNDPEKYIQGTRAQ